MVNKNKNSVKQSVKQSVVVKVHIGDKKKKSRAGKRKPRKSGGVSHVHAGATNPYAQAYNPVYIQSGPPPADEGLGSALLAAIKQMHSGTPAKPDEEVLHNPLMRSAGRAEPPHATPFRAPVRVTAPSDYSTTSTDTKIPSAVPIGRFHFTKTDPDYSQSDSDPEKPFMHTGYPYKPTTTLHNWSRRGSRDSGIVNTDDIRGEIHTPTIRPGFRPNIPSSTAVNYDADDDDDNLTQILDSDYEHKYKPPRLSAAAGGGAAAAGGGGHAAKPPTPRGDTGRRLNKNGTERKIRSDAGKGRVKPYKDRK